MADIRVVLIEDQSEYAALLMAYLKRAGYDDIHFFEDTVDIDERLRSLYVRPLVAITDYIVHPKPADNFLPEWRYIGLNFPCIILSGHKPGELIRLGAAQNAVVCQRDLILDRSKPETHDLIQDLLLDLTPEAHLKWAEYSEYKVASEFLAQRSFNAQMVFSAAMAGIPAKQVEHGAGRTYRTVANLYAELHKFIAGGATFSSRQYRRKAVFDILRSRGVKYTNSTGVSV